MVLNFKLISDVTEVLTKVNKFHTKRIKEINRFHITIKLHTYFAAAYFQVNDLCERSFPRFRYGEAQYLILRTSSQNTISQCSICCKQNQVSVSTQSLSRLLITSDTKPEVF